MNINSLALITGSQTHNSHEYTYVQLIPSMQLISTINTSTTITIINIDQLLSACNGHCKAHLGIAQICMYVVIS